MRIVLASASPRRKELMKLIAENFEVIASNADESKVNCSDIKNTACELAQLKAESVAKQNPDALVIGADTVVRHDSMILGKPCSAKEVRKMLKSLSGKSHFVDTGVCIIFKGEKISFTNTTQVEFYNISDEEIDCYIASGEPFDKAGAYGIQGKASVFVKSLNGDYFNVVGLPVAELYHKIKDIT